MEKREQLQCRRYLHPCRHDGVPLARSTGHHEAGPSVAITSSSTGTKLTWAVTSGPWEQPDLFAAEIRAGVQIAALIPTLLSQRKQPVTQLEKLLYTARVRTTGGRDGASRSSDGRLDVKLSPPGTPGSGANPEQLFAAGWSACFEGAIGLAARTMKITLPADPAIDAEVDLNSSDGAYFLRARLNVSLSGLDPKSLSS
jgi:lipoyl-dependent peroxiredoxin